MSVIDILFKLEITYLVVIDKHLPDLDMPQAMASEGGPGQCPGLVLQCRFPVTGRHIKPDNNLKTVSPKRARIMPNSRNQSYY
jgi:hypothetical protein